MPSSAVSQLSQFALDVAEGFSCAQKNIPPRYFYDELGSALFEAITVLPEYGLTRADERLVRSHAHQIASATGPVALVAELGSGTGRKTKHILSVLSSIRAPLVYHPIDVSSTALTACERELSDVSQVRAVCADWMDGLGQIARSRSGHGRMLLLFLGSSIGNLERNSLDDFLRQLRSNLRPKDFFLVGADLIKDIDTMVAAYDDPTGVTAAFNLNVLGRINRELHSDLDLRSFAHEIRWNSTERRIEMHLLSCRQQSVYIGALDKVFTFEAGETICTEFSHKFTEKELAAYARSSGFKPVDIWIDDEWPFTESLWQVAD